MKCPFCSDLENKVMDSRLTNDGLAVRRRRECLECKKRFTTYERVEEVNFLVVKKDGSKEVFDKGKLIHGMLKACEKRPITVDVIEGFISNLEREFQERGDKEISSTEIGERVIRKLYELDEVAYVRFASVYKDFSELGDFKKEIRELIRK